MEFLDGCLTDQLILSANDLAQNKHSEEPADQRQSI